MRPKTMPRRGKGKSSEMWFSPGILVAALVICLVTSLGVKASTWWVWILAALVATVIDVLLNVKSRRVPKVKTNKEYYKED